MQWTRRLLAMALASLSAVPPTFGRAEALGIIVQANRANLGEQPVSEGSSVFDGEKISTDDGGILQLRSGPVQFNLLGESSAVVRGSSDVEVQTFSAELEKGTAVLSVPTDAKGDICSRGACIGAANGGPVTVQVSVRGPKELRIYARRGNALLSYKSENVTITEGSSYIVVLDPPDDGSAPKVSGKRKKAFLLIALAAIPAAAIIIHVTQSHGPESPDRP